MLWITALGICVPEINVVSLNDGHWDRNSVAKQMDIKCFT